MVKNPPTKARDYGWFPGLGRSPGAGDGNTLQYFRLENPMDRGACRTMVHGVANSQTRLSMHTRCLKTACSLGYCNSREVGNRSQVGKRMTWPEKTLMLLPGFLIGPNPMTCIFKDKGSLDPDAQREDKQRDGSHAVSSLGMPRIVRNCQNLEEAKSFLRRHSLAIP